MDFKNKWIQLYHRISIGQGKYLCGFIVPNQLEQESMPQELEIDDKFYQINMINSNWLDYRHRIDEADEKDENPKIEMPQLTRYEEDEEKFETSDSLLPLINTTLTSRLSLWEPLIRKCPNIMLQAIPNVLSPLKKTNLRELMHKLDALREENSPKESKRVGSSTWIIVIIAIIGVMKL